MCSAAAGPAGMRPDYDQVEGMQEVSKQEREIIRIDEAVSKLVPGYFERFTGIIAKQRAAYKDQLVKIASDPSTFDSENSRNIYFRLLRILPFTEKEKAYLEKKIILAPREEDKKALKNREDLPFDRDDIDSSFLNVFRYMQPVEGKISKEMANRIQNAYTQYIEIEYQLLNRGRKDPDENERREINLFIRASLCKLLIAELAHSPDPLASIKGKLEPHAVEKFNTLIGLFFPRLEEALDQPGSEGQEEADKMLRDIDEESKKMVDEYTDELEELIKKSKMDLKADGD